MLKVKSTTYFGEICNQKAGKFLSERGKLESTCLFASSFRVNWEIFRVSVLKTVLPFLTNQAGWFISRGIGRSYVSRNLLLSFLLWYDFKIQVKSRGGDTFLCLAFFINVWKKHFFNWKLNIPSFIFLICPEQFWIWFSWKLLKERQTFCFFLKLFLRYPMYDFRILVQIYQSIIWFN